jgi:hypothetical protein
MIARRDELDEARELLRELSVAHRGEAVPALVSGDRRRDTNPLSE